MACVAHVYNQVIVWKLKREQKKYARKHLLRRLREKSTFPSTDTVGSGVMADFVPLAHPS